MDAELVSLINQKKNSIKTFSIKGTQINSSKSIKVFGDLTCNKLTCDNIEINPTGNKTQINDAEITNSQIDSTTIGLIEPGVSYFTQVNILSTINGNESQAINIDGDISFSNADEKERRIVSDNPFKVFSSKELTLYSTKKGSLRSDDIIDINSLHSVNLTSNTFNINTPSITTPGYLHILNNSNTNDVNSGSVIIDGGVGIKKNITIGGNINILGRIHSLAGDSASIIEGDLSVKSNISSLGNISIDSVLDSFNINYGALVVKGGMSIMKNANIGGNMNINSVTDSFNSSSGALIVQGGVGISKNVNVGGNMNIDDNINIVGNLNAHGKANLSGNITMNGVMNLNNSTDSINNSTGSTVIKGGIGIKKNVNIGGNVNIDGITHIYKDKNTDNTNTGALIVDGGVAIKKNLNIAGGVNIHQNLNILDTNKSLYVQGNTTLEKNIIINKNIFLKGKLLNELGNSISTKYKTVTIEDNLVIIGSEESINVNNGSFTTNGGVGVGKSLNIGENLNVLGNVTLQNNVNCIKTLYANNLHATYNITTTRGPVTNVCEPTKPFDTMVGNLNLSGNMTISNAFQAIDKWVNINLIDTPPILTNTPNSVIESGEFIEFDWNLPEQIYVGFLNHKVPRIDSIYIDYKPSSQNNWDTFTTVNMNSTIITKIKIYPFNYTNYSVNNTFYLYNITKETLYDFRIYCLNQNSARDSKYLYFNSLKTKVSLLLVPPSDINITSNTINPSKSININWNHTSSPNLPVYKYNITCSALQSLKYPTYIKHNTNIINTASNVLHNANNHATFTNLYPGHKYNVNIQAKNILNNTYGNFSYIADDTITTDYPVAPNYVNSSNLHIQNNNNYRFNINQGYTLDGNTFINNIFNYNKLDNTLKTNTLNKLRINENISTTDLVTTSLSGILNNTTNSIYSNLNLGGFSHTNTSTTFTNKLNIKVNDEGDYYNDTYNNGFYKTGDFYIQFDNPKNYLTPTINKYTLQLTQNLNHSNITYNSSKTHFYVDDVNNFSSISNINVHSLSNYTTQTLSGVPSIVSGNVNFDFIAYNLTNNFLRSDKKHFSIFTSPLNQNSYSNNLNITADDFKKSYAFYYNLDENKHNTNGTVLLPNTNQVLIKNMSIKLNTTNVGYTENINVNIIPYNLHGESPVYKNMVHSKIRLDNNSYITNQSIQDTTSSYGLYVTSGSVEYPETPGVHFGNTFNHSVNISTTKDLQLINGYFSTPYNINSFKNYSTYIYNGVLTYYDYSTVALNSNKRYITFKYTGLIQDTNKITIEFVNSNINIFNSTDFSIHFKIHNSSETQYNTAWLNANKYISNIGINNNTKNINDTGCLNTSSNYISTNKKKYCYLPNGSSGILYIRLGFASNKDYLIKFIKVTNKFI